MNKHLRLALGVVVLAASLAACAKTRSVSFRTTPRELSENAQTLRSNGKATVVASHEGGPDIDTEIDATDKTRVVLRPLYAGEDSAGEEPGNAKEATPTIAELIANCPTVLPFRGGATGGRLRACFTKSTTEKSGSVIAAFARRLTGRHATLRLVR